MDLQKRTLQIGAAAIACALLLRFGGGLLGQLTHTLGQPEVASVLLFLGTGRIARPTQPHPTTTQPPSIPVPTAQPEEEKAVAVFSDGDAALVEVNNSTGYETDVPAFLQTPLQWDLTQDAPAVLILHTHGTESYTNTENYTESAKFRTLDQQHNMISIGQVIADQLTAGGIQVIHDTTAHDAPSYNSAYTHARQAIQDYLAQYPSIRLILDVHRDSVEDASGQQLRVTVPYEDQQAAQLMLVMGTDAAGFIHPDWQENMALAVKLQAQLEKTCTGICRPISLRSQRFNQDLSPGALLVEVGTAGNTRQEALAAAQVLSQAILDLAYGSVSGYPLS